MEGWPVMPERARIVVEAVEVAQALEAREKRGGPSEHSRREMACWTAAPLHTMNIII